MTRPAGAAGGGANGAAGTADALAADVLAQCLAAERRLLAALARAAGHGMRDPTQAAQAVMASRMRRAAAQVATELRDRVGPLARQAVAAAARDGTAAAERAIRRVVAARPGLADLYLAPRGHATAAAKAIADDLASKLDQAALRITRFADDAYRAAVADAATRLVLNESGLETPRAAQARAWQTLVRDGVSGFTDRSGRRWNLATYVEMATRTATQRAYNEAHLARMSAAGVRWFTVSHDGRPCPLCAPWEGAVLSTGLAGPATAPSVMDGRPVSFIVAATIDQARLAGLFHPNCKHTLLAWLPGDPLNTPPREWAAEDQERYDATQRQRELERRVRQHKRVQAGALDERSRQEAGRRVRATQAQIRDHIARHDLNRHPERERWNLGHDGGDSSLRRTPSPTPVDWDGRREALERELGVQFDKDDIKSHEIEFYESFSAAGQVFTPINRDVTSYRRTPGDFVWRGEKVELKSILSARIDRTTLYRPIRKSVLRNTARQVFMVDLRDHPFTNDIRAWLSGYNTHPDNAGAGITRLFVFWGRRHVEEITLDK